MKKLIIILSFFVCILSCDKLDELSLTCEGDCNDITYIVDGETGVDVTYSNFNNVASIDKFTFSGTIIYNDSGNSYHVEGEAIYSPCSFTITVRDEDGNEATCGN